MSNSKQTENAVQVITNIETLKDTDSLINENLSAEQTMLMGERAIDVITEDKKHEIGELIDQGRSKLTKVNKKTKELKELYDEAYDAELNKQKDKVCKYANKQTDAITKSLVSFAKSSFKCGKGFSINEKSIYKRDDYGTAYEVKKPYEVNCKHTSGGKDMGTGIIRTLFEIIIRGNGNNGSYIRLPDLEYVFSDKVVDKYNAYKESEKEASNVTKYIFDLQNAQQGIEKLRLKMSTNVKRKSLAASTTGKELMGGLQSVVDQVKLPKLLS